MWTPAPPFVGRSGGTVSAPGCREPLAPQSKERIATRTSSEPRYCFEASQVAVVTPLASRGSPPLGGSLLTIRIAVQPIQQLLGHSPSLINDRSISIGDTWYRIDASSKRSSSGPLFWTNSFSDSMGQRNSVAKAR